MSIDYIIKPHGGLCNYLRVVFSYWLYCKREGKTLGVIWTVTDECPGFFLDFFEPLEGVTFFKENPGLLIDFTGNRWHPDYNPYIMNIFNHLKLVPLIATKLSMIQLSLGKYIAVHIRRTDHSDLAKAENTYTDDDKFISFINEYPEYNLYIATDNRDTQDKFYGLYKDRIKVIEFIKPSSLLRQTGLEESILDLFICAQSIHFKGSGWSSFTATINQFKEPVNSDGCFGKIISY